MLTNCATRIAQTGLIQFMRNRPKINTFYCLTLFAALFLSGCSDSEPLGNFSDPNVVTPVKYPFISEGVVYEYDPARQRTSQVLSLSDKIFTLLDTDITSSTLGPDPEETNVTVDDFKDFRLRNPLPNFIAYIEESTLWLYELEYRHTHEIYNFDSDSNISGRENVCNIEQFTIADDLSLEQGKLNLIDDMVIHVEAVPAGEDCSDPSQRTYYAIKLLPNPDQEFRIRQPSEDDNSGAFVNVIYPALYGEKTLSTESLMYSGIPIVDIPNLLSVHIGISRRDNTLNAYLTNIEQDETTPLWTLQGTDFSDFAEQRILANSEQKLTTLVNRIHRGQPYLRTFGSYIFSHDNNFFALDKDSVFDDDRNVVRLNALNSPFISLDPAETFRYDDIYQITENAEAFFALTNEVKIVIDDSQSMQTRDLNITEPGVQEKSPFYIEQGVGIIKEFIDGDTSIVSLSTGNVEQTIWPKSDQFIFNYDKIPGAPLNISFVNETSNSWETIFNSGLTQITASTKVTTQTIPVPFYDYRSYVNHDDEFSQGLSLALFNSPATLIGQPPALAPSSLYLYNASNDAIESRGEKITEFPGYLFPSDFNAIYVFNDEFGLATLESTDGSRLYFFDPANKADNDDIGTRAAQDNEDSIDAEQPEDDQNLGDNENTAGSDLEWIL